jgi:hypothetical protein
MKAKKIKLKNDILIKTVWNSMITMGLLVMAATVGTSAAGNAINNNNSRAVLNNFVKNSTFPFDTSLITCTGGTGGRDSCPINISRYSGAIYFQCFGGYAMCPENDFCDFLLSKEPLDSTSHLIQTDINEFCQPITTYHNANIQYIVKFDSSTLFMEVDSVYGSVSSPTQIILIKFDTTSFLSNTAIIPTNKNSRPQTRAGNFQNSKIQYFDIMGRILPANIIYRKRSSFADRLIITNQIKVLFQ